ncbi:RNA-guided endonuclease InsQ/TnpB family protein [Streptomyces sp. NPDC004012]
MCGSDTTTRLPGSLTVTKDSAGRYFLSFVVDTEPDVLPGLKTDAGIDLGLSAFAVVSDGSKIDNPASCGRAEKQLKRLQREFPARPRDLRTGEGSHQVARQHAEVADRRRDWHHKASTHHSRQPSGVRGRPRGVRPRPHRLAKSVHDAGWSAFVGMLEYKALKHGRTLAKVDRALPSAR